MGLSGCYGFIKYLMVFINVIFWILGLGVVILSVWMLTDNTFYFSMTQEQDHYRIALFVLLTIGALWLIVAFLGCCGAFRESQCMLISFFSCLLVILVAEVAAGVWAYTNATSLELKIRKAVRLTVQEEYSVDDRRTETFDVIQKELHCCGADGPSDWNDSEFNKNEKKVTSFALTKIGILYDIPKSCCQEDISELECATATRAGPIGTRLSDAIYSQGCTDKFVEALKQHLMIVSCITIGIIAIEVLGIIFSLVLCFAINRSDRYKA